MKERSELESMTKDELVAYANENEIEVNQHWVKDDIIKEIVKGQKAHAKADAKTESEKAEADKTDSVRQFEANLDNFEKESRAAEENQEIANFHGLPKPGETREQLLDRIRQMRDNPPKEPEPTLFRSEALQKEFELEQEAGRAAVAKAEELRQKYLALVAKEAEGEKNKAG